MAHQKERIPKFSALIPLFVFVFTFLGVGIYQNDFYALPAPISVIAGIIVAFLLWLEWFH